MHQCYNTNDSFPRQEDNALHLAQPQATLTDNNKVNQNPSFGTKDAKAGICSRQCTNWHDLSAAGAHLQQAAEASQALASHRL